MFTNQNPVPCSLFPVPFFSMLLEIRRPALGSFTFLALGDGFNLTAFKKGLHFNLAPA